MTMSCIIVYTSYLDNFIALFMIVVQLRIVSVLTLMERTVYLAFRTQEEMPLELK